MTFDPSTADQTPSLDALWQQQSTLNVDTRKVVKMAKSQRLKQRFYIFLDVMSLTPYLLFLVWDIELTIFLKAFIAVNAFAGMIMIGYFIKLRWISAFGEYTSTEDYKTRLLQQLKNNAKIAFINKHLAWVSMLLAVSVIALHATFFEDEPFVFTKKIIMVSIIAPLLLVPWWIWASKRQARFEREFNTLSTM